MNAVSSVEERSPLRRNSVSGYVIRTALRNNPWVKILRAAFLCLGVLVAVAAHLPAHAENGTSQAIIALIVPPGSGNAPAAFSSKTTVYQPNPISATYNPDTSFIMPQMSGAVAYQIWVAI